MDDLLALMGHIVRTYCEHHFPEMLDDPWASDAEHLDAILSGWWWLGDEMGWSWWFGVYSLRPDGRDEDSPHCLLDAPLPRANFQEWIDV